MDSISLRQIQQEPGIWRQISEGVYYFCYDSLLRPVLIVLLSIIIPFPLALVVFGGIINMICFIMLPVGLLLYMRV